MIIKGFSRYDSTVQSLPILENYPPCRDGRLHRRKLPARVLRIGSVKIIGHADFDAQRGRAFEQSISVTRAQEVERELRTRVDRLTWEFDPTVNPLRKTGPLSNTIDWQSSGVGATQPAAENVNRHRTEHDRGGSQAQPPGRDLPRTRINAREHAAFAGTQQANRGHPGGSPSHSYFAYPAAARLPLEITQARGAQNLLGYGERAQRRLTCLDADTMLGTIKDNISSGDPNWTNDFLQGWQKLEDERRLRNDVPPRRGVDPVKDFEK